MEPLLPKPPTSSWLNEAGFGVAALIGAGTGVAQVVDKPSWVGLFASGALIVTAGLGYLQTRKVRRLEARPMQVSEPLPPPKNTLSEEEQRALAEAITRLEQAVGDLLDTYSQEQESAAKASAVPEDFVMVSPREKTLHQRLQGLEENLRKLQRCLIGQDEQLFQLQQDVQTLKAQTSGPASSQATHAAAPSGDFSSQLASLLLRVDALAAERRSGSGRSSASVSHRGTPERGRRAAADLGSPVVGTGSLSVTPLTRPTGQGKDAKDTITEEPADA